MFHTQNEKKKKNLIKFYYNQILKMLFNILCLYILSTGSIKKSIVNSKMILENKIKTRFSVLYWWCWWFFKMLLFALLCTSLLSSSPLCTLYKRPFLFIKPSSFISSFDKIFSYFSISRGSVGVKWKFNEKKKKKRERKR